ncbi:MAG: hypothetical protein HRT67_09430 [Flavobacteriaceae bacterium]|nr:hypothetical protein [Flavobacteriaceae bacterium]
MKTLAPFLVFAIAPLFAKSQNTNVADKVELKSKTEIKVVIKKIDRISNNPLKQNKDINAKKSNDLISVEAYIKSLQLKRKADLMS